MVLCGPTTKDESGAQDGGSVCAAALARQSYFWRSQKNPLTSLPLLAAGVRVPTAIIHTLIRVNLFLPPGVLTPSLSHFDGFL